MSAKGLKMLSLNTGSSYTHDDGRFFTAISGFRPHTRVELPEGFTHFGLVVEGEIELCYGNRRRRASAGDFFSVAGGAVVKSEGIGAVSSARGYRGLNLVGGPLEAEGRLRYIDGCTDTLLVPPVRKGDPCFNHLHFPPNTVQTPHTHPTVRVNVVYRGSGICVVPEEEREVSLRPGYIFVMLPETVHSFNTVDESMDVITFHPDSDTGMTDDDHPMLNRTIVEGTKANLIDSIRTRPRPEAVP